MGSHRALSLQDQVAQDQHPDHELLRGRSIRAPSRGCETDRWPRALNGLAGRRCRLAAGRSCRAQAVRRGCPSQAGSRSASCLAGYRGCAKGRARSDHPNDRRIGVRAWRKSPHPRAVRPLYGRRHLDEREPASGLDGASRTSARHFATCISVPQRARARSVCSTDRYGFLEKSWRRCPRPSRKPEKQGLLQFRRRDSNPNKRDQNPLSCR
jgi:hypothetical protein